MAPELGGRRAGRWEMPPRSASIRPRTSARPETAGAVAGKDSRPARRVRKLRDTGRTTKYEHDEIGFGDARHAPGGAPPGQAAHLERVERGQRLPMRLGIASSSAGRRSSRAVGGGGRRHVCHLYVIRTGDRDDLLAGLREQESASASTTRSRSTCSRLREPRLRGRRLPPDGRAAPRSCRSRCIPS